jgi:hypothetical protein
MGISIRGMAIGALTELKEKRVFAAEEERTKRLEDRKFKNQSRLQRQADDAAALRNKYTADTRLQVARDNAEAKKIKENRTAMLSFSKTWDQFGIGGESGLLGRNLPEQFRVLRDRTPDALYRGKFDGAIGYVIGEFQKIENLSVRNSQFNNLNTFLAKRFPQLLTETNAHATDTSKSGKYNYEQMFDLRTAFPQTYAYMNSVDSLKDVLNAQKQEFAELYKIPDNINALTETNPKSFTAKRLNKSFGKRGLYILGSLHQNWVVLADTGMVQAIAEGDRNKMLSAVDKMYNTKSLKKNNLIPQQNLDAIVAAASVAIGFGKDTVISRGAGRQTRTVINSDIREKQIKDARKIHRENQSLLHQVTKANELNIALRVGTDYSKKATFTLNIFRHFETMLNSLNIGFFNFDMSSKEDSITFGEKEKEEMAKAFSKAGIEDGEEFFNKMQQSSNNKLAQARTELSIALKGGDIYEQARMQERFRNEVKYEALKIQLVYKVAKMVQGGSGGQAVSNADFQAVLKSFQAGKWGNLQYESAVFEQLQSMVEREYIYSKVMTNRAVLSNEDAVATRALQFYRIQEERMRQYALRDDQSVGKTEGSKQLTRSQKLTKLLEELEASGL